MKFAHPLALAAALAAAASWAQTASAQAAATVPSAATSAKPPKEKKHCRSEEATGSIMTSKGCHTDAEWAAIDKQNQADADSFRRSRDLASGGH